jgi:hypothetical protein
MMELVRKYPAAAILPLLFLLSPLSSAGAEEDALRTAALDYAEGWLSGDAERVAGALHPQMLRRRVVRDLLTDLQTMQEVDAATFIDATRAGVGTGGGPLSFRVAVLDQHGDMAVVRMVSELYVEYLQMVRWESRWVILSVLWGPLSAPEG